MASEEITIIYLTENRLAETIAKLCRKHLVIAADGKRIISVSQKPINLGDNICVGDIGRSWLNIYKQQLVGLKEAKTKYVAIAEHDVLYTKEHFNWMPKDDETFWFNDNCWFVEWGGNHPEMDGMYSKWSSNRKALSQLICNRELLIKSVEERLELIEGGLKIMRKLGEPGSFPKDVVEAAKIAVSGKPDYLKNLLDKHLTQFKSESFNTVNPNLDIRHKTNFTGPRRGKKRRYYLEPWGEFKNIWQQMKTK